MKVTIAGQGAVDLAQRDFLASGGQGEVYVKGDTAFKVYHNPATMIPTGKIAELSALADPHVIKPEKVLLDPKGTPIGYTMRFVKDTHVLCQTFNRAFRDREGLTNDMVLKLIRQMQGVLIGVHAAKILVVDLNEMNFLVGKDFKDVFFLDADSYQTSHYHATALMDSVRDRHMKGPHDFNEGTDWFAFGIVTFQMLVGIHPYKGKHPTLPDLDVRMKANVSVLNPAVGVPKACYPFDMIPSAYKAWYKAVFDDGLRVPPPADFQAVVVISPATARVMTSVGVNISELEAFDSPIRVFVERFGHRTTLTRDRVYFNGRHINTASTASGVVFTPSNAPVSVSRTGRQVTLYNLAKQEKINFDLVADDMMVYDGRLYVRCGDQVQEAQFHDMGTRTVVIMRDNLHCLEYATRLYDGVVYQSLLGTPYFSVFPATGKTYTMPVKELTGYQIIGAKFDHGVLVIVGSKNGKYDRFVLRFDTTDYATYDLRKIADVSFTGVNFVTLDSGVCVLLNEEEDLEVFSSRKDSIGIKTVKDPVLGNDMYLFQQSGQVVFSRGEKLYSMKMR